MPTVALRWLDPDGAVQQGDLSALSAAETAGWLWLDVTDPDEGTLKALGEQFGFHELALEDAAHTQRRPKLDVYPDGLFLAWLTPVRPRGDGVTAQELDVFVCKRYLVTLHKGVTEAIDTVARDAERTMASGPDWTLHAIIDLLVDSAIPLIDRIGEELMGIGDKMLDNPRQDDLRSLHRVRRQMTRLHRIVSPERDIIRELAREGEVISEDAYRYFNDVGDHIAMAQDSIETYQDVGQSSMDIYLSAQSNRMNEIMKQLTVVATIFMPLTLISGIYGMNLVRNMWPSPAWAWSFGAVILAMAVIAVSMAAYFRRKNWW